MTNIARDQPTMSIEIKTPKTDSPWGIVGRTFVLSAVAMFSKALLGIFNTTTVSNHEEFLKSLNRSNERRRLKASNEEDTDNDDDRSTTNTTTTTTTIDDNKLPIKRGLITVANHHSTFDDPGVLAYMTPLRYFLQEILYKHNRWTLCTAEVATANKFTEQFILSGKGIPIYRGGGIDQPCMKVMAELVARGEWLQIFPEGKVNRASEKFDERLKWGLGKILCDVEEMGGEQPIVLPFWHSGMDKVKPYDGCKTIFRWGHRVHITVGEPIDLSQFRGRCMKCTNDEQKGNLYAEMMAVVRTKMNEVREKNEEEIEAMNLKKASKAA